MQVSPYLSFDGQCEAAFKFYEKCLQGKIESMMPYEGSPMAGEVPAEWGNKVMHGEFRLGDLVLMGSDCMPSQYGHLQRYRKMERSPCRYKRLFGRQSLAPSSINLAFPG